MINECVKTPFPITNLDFPRFPFALNTPLKLEIEFQIIIFMKYTISLTANDNRFIYLRNPT